MRSGNSSSPPSPNVKASGGLPVKTSSADARSVDIGQQSHAAIRSRWECIVPFGLPVVPDVKAITQVSSAAVSTAANVGGLLFARASRPSLASVPKYAMRVSEGQSGRARSSSSARRASHSACETCALPTMSQSSFARSSGIVATTMPPALTTANQQAAIVALLGARSSTRLPGTRPMSSTSTRAIRFDCAASSAYVQRTPSGSTIAVRAPSPRSSARSTSSTAQLIRCAYCNSGNANIRSGHWSRGGRLSRANVST